jgi:lysozyme
MKLDINGINLLVELEGLKLNAYKCSANVWTIGLGNTFYENGSKVKEGDKITKDEAYHLFYMIATKFEKTINDNLKIEINQNQFNALFCLCYNIGQVGFKNSTLLRLVNINPNDGNIAKEFLKWNKIKGIPSKGLTNRRIKESALYFTK